LSYANAGNDPGLGTGGFTYYTGLNDSEVGGLQGGTHNAVVIDLYDIVALGANLDNFTAHFTMGCGNDNLMGNGSVPAPVPEPATLLLTGIGLAGIGVSKKYFNKKKI